MVVVVVRGCRKVDGGEPGRGEGREVNRASLSDTVTSHRWKTIVQLITFQHAGSSSEERAWTERRGWKCPPS